MFRSVSVLQMKSDPGFTLYQVRNHVLVSDTPSQDAELALRPLDEVIAIEGQPVTSVYDVPRVFDRIEPDSLFTVSVRRAGRVIQPITLVSRPIPMVNWVISGAARLLVPAVFLVTGLVVFLLKPYDKQALLLALMFGMFIGAIMAIGPSFGGEPSWLVGVMLTINLSSLFLWPVFFHFFLIFPEPSPLLRRAPALEKWLYVPHLISIFPYFATLNLLAAFAPEKLFVFRNQFQVLASLSIVVATTYIAAGLLSLWFNYREATLVSRRKMRVVVAGSIAGFLPMFIEIALAIAFNLQRRDPLLAQWLGIIALFSFPLFPLSFAYAIVRHQVIPVHLILRRGVRYLLVARGFIIIQAIFVFGVLSFLLTGKRLQIIDSFGARADIVVTMAATTMAIALLTFLNQRVMPIIDRRFFREAYDAQQLLADLGMAVRRATTARQVADCAVEKIQQALHVASVAIFLRHDATGDYRCVVVSRFTENTDGSDASRLELPGEGYLCRRLRQSSSTSLIELERPRSWLSSLDAQSGSINAEIERSTLSMLKPALLVPVATKDELIGVVAVGKRMGDLPYSREDRQLLSAISWQLGFAVQNAQLIEDAAEQEKLQHELQIAANVQRRLFPESPPVFDRLDLAGVCLPAQGVGGDYYDFIVLDERKVGIAVADVAGKGISAALLMSTVQASLRIQAPSVNGNLIELVSSMNRLLHSSTDGSSYATFFYAQFDEQTGTLTYVNAGHNPPMLVRARGSAMGRGAAHAGSGLGGVAVEMSKGASGPLEVGDTVIRRLTAGGPMIGAFDNCEYEQQSLQLNEGDILVAYTDGVTEALTHLDEEFGEERLRKLVASSLSLSASELMSRITETVHDWCGDRPLQDDLTLVVMKVRQ